MDDKKLNDTEVGDLFKSPNDFSLAFARELLKQIVYNPQKSSLRNSYNYSNYTKENIIKWLQSPANNEKNLRNASIYLYLFSMHYQRLINYYANLPTWAYVLSPLNFDKAKIEEKKKKDAFRKQYLKVSHNLELLNIPETMRNILNVVLRDGVYYGIRWSDNSSSFIQKIDPDYCRITAISDGVFLYSVDMSKITGDKLDFYPPVFKEMARKYEATGVAYQEVPADLSVCIKADPTIPDYSVPLFGSVMPSLYTIANTEALQETQDELNNYKMVYGKVPVDKDGQPIIPWDLVLKYYQNVSNALGDQVGLGIAPFDIETVDFESSGGVAEVDIISRSISNFWATAGTSGLLHGVSNNTAGVTKLAIKNDENYINGIIGQIERWFNRYLKTAFSGTIKFKIKFLPITIYNREEFIKMYKESVPFGIGKSYYVAALGIPQSDIEGLSYLEDEVLDFKNNLTPLINSHNASSSDLGDGAQGRPSEDEEDLGDAGEATRDDDTNENR